MGRQRTELDEATFQRRQQYYQRNKERILGRAKQFYAENREELLGASKEARAAIRLNKKEKAASKESQEQARKYVWDYLRMHPMCKDCRQEYPQYCLDTYHVEGPEVLSLEQLIKRGYGEKVIEAELGRSVVICKNCKGSREFFDKDNQYKV